MFDGKRDKSGIANAVVRMRLTLCNDECNMAMKIAIVLGRCMPRRYSIDEARKNLAAIVREAETVGPIEFTRNDKGVAVLLSQVDYDRLAGGRKDFWEAYEAFRVTPDFTNVDVDPEIFTVRDTLPARDVNL